MSLHHRDHHTFHLPKRVWYVIALTLTFLIWPYINCAIGVLYNYIWWILFSSTVQWATPNEAQKAAVNRVVVGGGLSSDMPVPKFIHQTWKDRNVPDKWKAAQKSCQDMHPGYEYRLWTDAEARKLIATRFPWFLATYDNYPHAIQRADALRYFVLYEYGGIYIDLDIQCLKSLDFLRAFNFTAPKTYPVGVSNDIMASRPRDPFAMRLTQQLRTWDRWLMFKYITVMFTTGPMYVTVQYALHEHKSWVSVLPVDLYGKYDRRSNTGGTSVALMHHLHGSSWHGNDAKGFFFFEKHWKGILAAGGLALLGLAYLTLRWAQQQQRPSGVGLIGGRPPKLSTALIGSSVGSGTPSKLTRVSGSGAAPSDPAAAWGTAVVSPGHRAAPKTKAGDNLLNV